jgi:hypothetical protein
MKDKKLTRKSSHSESGAILPIVIILMLALTITGLAFLNAGVMENSLVRKEIAKTKAFWAAEAGIEYGLFRLRALLLGTVPPDPTAAELDAIAAHIEANLPISGFTFDITIEKDGDPGTKLMETGSYAGLIANVQGYKISSEATSTGGNPTSAKIIQTVEDQRFYLFQFGIFYSDVECELQPGPDMTFEGRVHSNKDIYLDAGSTLMIDSYLTSAGKIIKGSKPWDPAKEGGTVTIKDDVGVYQDMYYDNARGIWFDSNHPDWVPEAGERWDGNVQDQAYGATELRLPLPALANPMEIIKRGDTINPDNSSESEILKSARLYWQADLRILDGVAYLKSGDQVYTEDKDGFLQIGLAYEDPEHPGEMINPIASKSFYNYREGATITVVEIDIEKLMRREELINNGTIGGNLCLGNGILYVSESGSNKGVRLVNGSEMPSGGLTVATDNPLYIQGDYNTVNKEPAAVFCDALNILSNDWDDSPDHDRIASGTAVNVSLVTGIVTTKEGYPNYSGGVENLPRFLENWSGKTYTYKGSMVVLWESEQATGEWIYGMPYYTAPYRNWGFDQDLLEVANLPPGTPQVGTVEKIHWQQE